MGVGDKIGKLKQHKHKFKHNLYKSNKTNNIFFHYSYQIRSIKSHALAKSSSSLYKRKLAAPNQFIDSSSYAGAVAESIQQIENPKLFGDLKIRHYLADCLALSLKVFSVFFTLVTLYDVWRTLKKKFGVQSEARVLQLRYEMNIMRKSH